MGRWEEARRLFHRSPLNPSARSRALLKRVVGLAKGGRFKAAQDLMDEERMYPIDRFEALLALADGLMGKGGRRQNAARKTLREAWKLIRQSEFFPDGRRHQFLLELAKRFKALGSREDIEIFHQILSEAAPALRSELQDIDRREIAGGDYLLFQIKHLLAEKMELPGLALWNELQEKIALEAFRYSDLRRAAVQLGYRPGDLRRLKEEAAKELPREIQEWVVPWAHYGAALAPQPRVRRQEIATALQRILQNNFASTHPLREKIHLAAMQGLRGLDSDLLLRTLREPVGRRREKIALAWKYPVAGDLSEMDWPEADRVLFQSLSWLARRGEVEDRAMIEELLREPGFPETWKRPLERALRRRGIRT
ncbi:MAG: hypothetical protein ACREP8_16425, partial [Candidatus Binatia bacterium]